MDMKNINAGLIPRQQAGATLIEVLVAILLLSFGLLSLAGLHAFAIQMPKLAAYRATASSLANSYIESIRANPQGFSNGSYDEALYYTGGRDLPSVSGGCTYPNCTADTLAALDKMTMKFAVRRELDAGGMRLARPATVGGVTNTNQGDLWIFWLEPSSGSTVDSTSSDNCPPQINSYTPRPRCLYIRFQL
jgi:type IV pilus assembly protein PilV